MSPVFVITVLLWLSVAGLAFALVKRAAYWREGRATAAGAYGWANLLTIPKRYFVDLHHVVARDPYIAKTHVATAAARFWPWRWCSSTTGWRSTRPGSTS
jgi:hypothetical protein